LLIEILSPSTSNHDRRTKRALYASGGVPEYWLVNPKTRTIEVLALVAGKYLHHVRATGDDLVTSLVVPGLSFPASAAFA
jgi:Uma2 family endonuclease